MEEIPKHDNENPPTELLPLQMPIKPIKPDLDENSQDEEDEDDDEAIVHIEGSYNPTDYEHLNTTAEIKELFQFIMHYTPQNIDLEHKLRPFIPDFIPAVGDIDAFIKVPPPNGESDKLGLQVLDEPTAKQSDPTVLDLQLRAILKESTTKTTVVKSLDNADKRPKEIEAWVKNMGNLHRSKPPPTVHYTRNMPDIESLMQEWDPEFEEMLKQNGLPSGNMDCALDEYVQLVCALLDIPIYKSKVQSLHVLFSLYLEFRNLQHFNTGMTKSQSEDTPQADRLVIQ